MEMAKMENNEIKNSKLIPRLRFPGFTGEWEEKKLGEVGTFIRGLSYSNTEVTQDTSTTLVIRSNNILQDGVVDLKDGLQFVTKTPSKEQLLKEGDVVICLANGSSNLVGKTATFDGNYTGIATVGAFCGIYRSVMPICKYLVQTSAYKNMINLIKQGGNGALANLYGKDILGLSFSFPSLPEQQKIASCLSELDNLIAAQSQKVDALKEKKKGLMQQLFPQPGETTPRLRFPGFEGEWVEKKLGEILNERKEVSTITEKLPQLSFTIAEGVIKPEDRKTNQRDFLMTDKDNKKFAVTRLNDIIYNPANVVYGAIHKNNLCDGVVSPIYKIFWTKENPDFFNYLLRRPEFISSLASRAEGTVTKLKTLKAEAFLDMNVWFPIKPAEQLKIAECLSSLDNLIAAESAKVEALKDHKKGLMQQLFPQGSEISRFSDTDAQECAVSSEISLFSNTHLQRDAQECDEPLGDAQECDEPLGDARERDTPRSEEPKQQTSKD